MRDGRGGKWEQAALLNGYATHPDAMPHGAYVGWQRRCLAEMMRLLRPDGAGRPFATAAPTTPTTGLGGVGGRVGHDASLMGSG